MILRLQDWTKAGIALKPHSGEQIEPFKAGDNERVAYDLHVGDRFKKPGYENSQAVTKSVNIRAHSCLRIRTAEELTVPHNVFGVLSCRSSISFRGLLTANAKVDPLFCGQLDVTVFNITSRTITLTKGEAFCSVFFSRMLEPVDNKASPRRPPEVKPVHHPIYYALQPYFLSIATFAISVSASLLASYIFLVVHA